MKVLFAAAVVCGLTGSALTVHAQSSGERTLVVAGWGDPYLAEWRKSLIPNFEKKYDAKIVWVPGFSGQTMAKVIAAKDTPSIDVAMLDEGPHQRLVEAGLVEKIDRNKLTHANQMMKTAFLPDGYGIGFAVTGTGLFYNKKIFAEKAWRPPTSWADLFDPKFKGRISAHNLTNANGLNLLLAMNDLAGGKIDNLDPGFAKMKELAPSVITFDKQNESYALIQQGEAVIGEWSIDRIGALSGEGVPVEFVYPKEGAYGYTEVATIVKGRPNADLAHAFIDMLLSPEEQELTARRIGLGPLNREVKLPPEVARNVIYGEENIDKMKTADWSVINKMRAAWTARWNAEVEAAR
jgi:putative spermidine/putrescine transport system substrate-binding protein